MTKKKNLTIRDEALEIVRSSQNSLAFKEICSFQDVLELGYVTVFVVVFIISIIGLTFGVDKLFKINLKADAYAGAISLGATLAFAGELLMLADRRTKQTVERHTFYSLEIAQLPEVDFEDCYFENCTFDVDLSTAILKRCSFSECRFSSRVGRSVEDCRFCDCSFSGATIDPGFYFRHSTRGCDFTYVKTGEVYPHSHYPTEGWIGWLSCDHNARSPYLRCAINPVGPCSNACPDFSRPPVFTDVQHVEI